MTLSVAIIGAGPAGFYAADSICSSFDDASIDIIERLPSPFGLVRGGVAPDHQPTKQVAKKFARIAEQARIRFFGNVEVGKDISIDALRELYDVVVLAIGAPLDRPLGVPGADKTGVYGAQAFVGWYNGHPDFAHIDPNLDVTAAAVIGNGNVALDIARLLVRSEAGRARTDMPPHVRARMNGAAVKDVYLIGRRGPTEAKFTNVELREMLDLNEGLPIIDPADLPDGVPDDIDGRDRRLAERNLGTFRAFLDMDPSRAKRRVHFKFYLSPVEILGGECVEGIRLERNRLDADGNAVGSGDTVDIPCGLVVSAIGYRGKKFDGLPFDEKRGIVKNDAGRVDKGLYVTGWIMRGPSGVISSSRPDGAQVAEGIAKDFPAGGTKPGRPALVERLSERNHVWVDFDDWKALDAAELARAEHPEPRRKFTDVDEMMRHVEDMRR